MKSIRLGVLGMMGAAAPFAAAGDLVAENAAGPWGEVAAPIARPHPVSSSAPFRLPWGLLAGIGVGVIYWRRGAGR